MTRDSNVHGVLIVDKPSGPTSHDVVAWARRALGTRAVGHAGTLDPMATGVLVLAIGEGTKLVPYLTLDDKAYEFELALGTETDTLDAQGTVVASQAVPTLDAAMLERALAGFVGEQDQRPPVFSAIKVEGEALHRRARRGEHVEAPMRRVTVHSLELRSVSPLVLRVHASKGFFVRSLGRDIARAISTVGHVTVLRRLASGSFRVEDAIPGESLRAARDDDALRPSLLRRVLPLRAALASLPSVTLDAVAESDARAGRLVRIAAEGLEGTVVAMLDARGGLVAIGERRGDALAVRRGFRSLPVDD